MRSYQSSSGGTDVVGSLLIAVVVAAFVFLCGYLAGARVTLSKLEVAVKGETPICRAVE